MTDRTSAVGNAAEPALWVGLVSLIPELLAPLAEYGVSRRAFDSGALAWQMFNPRAFSERAGGKVDDKPYGGGPGMVLQAQPLLRAIEAAVAAAPRPPRVLLTSAQGRPLDQARVRQWVAAGSLVVVCPRYEGVDERVLDVVDEEFSIGDFVLTGGEPAAFALLDAASRWLPGTLGNDASAPADSFVDGLLEGPQWTRPEVLPGFATVPGALLSGDHARIERHRRKAALRRTLSRRPELLRRLQLDARDRDLLREIFAAGVESEDD
ncbi:MAG: tRNA (guanosine(37)-N1)-methyltransferase TrmD [Pseudomonadota bacterium]